MQVGLQARADWRALTSAAFIGSSVGLSLGVAYLAAGMGQAAAERDRTVQVASALRPEIAPAVTPILAQEHFAQGRPAPTAQVAAMDPDAKRIAAAKPSRARELDCLTQAVYFEARGESARGQAAVATVIMNRVKSPAFPKTVCDVVYQGASRRHGCQFSFACDGLVERVVENSAWRRARQVAARTLSGAVLRDVGSATHFHTTAVAPEWGSRMLRVAEVGLHVFYRFNPQGSRRSAAQPAEASVEFTSAPAPAQPELRLAVALTGSASEAAQTPPATTAAHPADAKAAVRIEVPAAAPVAKADSPGPAAS